MQGTIKRIMSDRGYGFILAPDQEDDIFFHQSNVADNKFTQLREGQKVEFEMSEGRKGPEAINITFIE